MLAQPILSRVAIEIAPLADGERVGRNADRRRALGGVERLEQRARRIFFKAEYPGAPLGTVANLRGIGPEECRRPCYERPVDHGEVQRQVMPFDTPAPRVPRRWRTENREEVALGIAHESIGLWRLRGGGGLCGLEGREDALELHDLRRRHVAALAQTSLQELARERLLRRVHLFEGQAVPCKGFRRNEVPVSSLIAVEGEGCLLALLWGETLEKLRGGRRHPGRRRSGVDRHAQCRRG